MATAQIIPPDLLCVKKDTLFFEAANNTCGPFQAYVIYGSMNLNGPYIEIGRVTDPSQQLFIHVNGSAADWYYYMEADHTCPGQTPLQSDTLDNNPPSVNPIRSVSVDGTEVVIDWAVNLSPEVTGYVIFRTTNVGTIPIDTVFGQTTYRDLNANPLQQSESYFVLAIDDCGNTSIFDRIHSSIFLQATEDACDRSILLQWPSYQGWAEGIDRQEIYLGVDGAEPELFQSLGPADTTLLIPNLADRAYCFYVRSIRAGAEEVEARSNLVCLQPDLVQTARDIFITRIGTEDDLTMTIEWIWNTDADLEELTLLQRIGTSDAIVPIDLPVPDPLPASNRYRDMTADPALNFWTYQLVSRNECDSISQTSAISSIFLSAASDDQSMNRLQWTAFDHPAGEVLRYEIYREEAGIQNLIATTGPGETAATDLVNAANRAERKLCYRVVAVVRLQLPDGTERFERWPSNQTCVEQQARLFVPNAFVPEGLNSEFKPRLVFGDGLDYRMEIYDRWGNQLFVSEDVNVGWRGKNGTLLYPWGVYLYLIRVTQRDGSVLEKKGTLMLVR